MTKPRKSPSKTHLTALAAFSIASLGSIAAAGAHPGHTSPVPPQPRPTQGHYDDSYERPDYDLDDDGILEHVEIDYRHYDSDRDGVLGPSERTAYWMHMFDMGKVDAGGISRADKVRLARMASYFDQDRDGRLTDTERVAISRLIRARKAFVNLDRNRDNNVTRREARMSLWRNGDHDDGRRYIQDREPSHYDSDGSDQGYRSGFFGWYDIRRPDPARSNNWISRRFETLDRNNNSRVSWNEVESYVIVSFRRGNRL